MPAQRGSPARATHGKPHVRRGVWPITKGKARATGLLLTAAAAITAVTAGCGKAPPPPQVWYDGPQRVTMYSPSQVHAVDRSLGYTVVEPVAAVRGTARLPLTEVIVTEVMGRKLIHYEFGNLHQNWDLVSEAPVAQTPLAYDPNARAVTFAARGRGIEITANLAPATVERIVRRLGGPPGAVPGG